MFTHKESGDITDLDVKFKGLRAMSIIGLTLCSIGEVNRVAIRVNMNK